MMGGRQLLLRPLQGEDCLLPYVVTFYALLPDRIFSHPNVLPVLGACQAPPAPHPIIITHWMPYGSLYNVLHEGTSESHLKAAGVGGGGPLLSAHINGECEQRDSLGTPRGPSCWRPGSFLAP